MKILFTGGSSFTGYWFIKELAAAGHEVTAVFRKPPSDYTGMRKQRVELLSNLCEAVFPCQFGDEVFLQKIQSASQWDLLCHHAADVTNYKSRDFDTVAAVANNTANLRAVLQACISKGCKAVLLTGSVFEQNEGAGSTPLRAFSPYGLSKGLTAEVFSHYCLDEGIILGKFVIPNPFGPYEEPRFTSYLIRSWFKGETPAVNTPAYVRDNIHVSLLAKAYVAYAQEIAAGGGRPKLNPSGYPESQGAFAQRFAMEMKPRLSLPCQLELRRQKEFVEPAVRINADIPDADALGWDEAAAWDELAQFYLKYRDVL